MKPLLPRPSRSRPARPLDAVRRPAVAGGSRLLSDAAWQRIEPALRVRAANAETMRALRRQAEELLWALRRDVFAAERRSNGSGRSDAYELWLGWLADGTWERFWKAYVEQLDARLARLWRRSLERAGTRLARTPSGVADLPLRRAVWLVSLAALERRSRTKH